HDQNHYCLTEQDIIELAHMVMLIEQHYSAHYRKRYGNWTPMDIEWAKDGIDGKIYIVQARPETVHAGVQQSTLKIYTLDADRATLAQNILLKGISVGQHIATGIARIIDNIEDIATISSDEIIIADMTNPDWVPAMKQAAGIITNRGGRTCHAAIVSRELGIPAIVGTQYATERIVTGQKITLDCSNGTVGIVYDGNIPFTASEVAIDQLACGIGMMAAAFYPRPIIVRFSDFKSNEYHNLIGGKYFEQIEENPMIGFRGASRYYHPQYQEAFALECEAMKIVRNTMGLTNVKLMIPY